MLGRLRGALHSTKKLQTLTLKENNNLGFIVKSPSQGFTFTSYIKVLVTPCFFFTTPGSKVGGRLRDFDTEAVPLRLGGVLGQEFG